MLRLKILDATADGFLNQYRAMLSSIAGEFARILDTPDPTTAKARREFSVIMNRQNMSFLSGFWGQITERAKEVAQTAVTDSGFDLNGKEQFSLNEHLADALIDLCGVIKVSVLRDENVAEKALRRIALQVDLLQSSTGVNKVGALIKVKFGKVRELDFMQIDRTGRRRSSEVYTRLAVRHCLLLIYVESYLIAIAKNGQDLARVVYPDGKLGEVFSITGATPGYRAYDDLKNEVFHPNSTASVSADVKDK